MASMPGHAPQREYQVSRMSIKEVTIPPAEVVRTMEGVKDFTFTFPTCKQAPVVK